MKYKVGDLVKIGKEKCEITGGESEVFTPGWVFVKVVSEGNTYNNNSFFLPESFITGLWEEEFEEGEEVEVSTIKDGLYMRRIYLFTNKKGKHVCVDKGQSNYYKYGSDDYSVIYWDNIRKIPKKELTTLQVLATKDQLDKIQAYLDGEGVL